MNNKIQCPVCGADDCYKESESNVDSYLCVSCGYTTNSLYLKNSVALSSWEKSTPKLISNSKFVDDKTNLVWYPSVLNFPSMGMIFPDGPNEFEWQWRVAKIVEIPEEEQNKYPVPNTNNEFYKSKLDMESSKFFERTDFKNACIELGILEELE